VDLIRTQRMGICSHHSVLSSLGKGIVVSLAACENKHLSYDIRALSLSQAVIPRRRQFYFILCKNSHVRNVYEFQCDFKLSIHVDIMLFAYSVEIVAR
jgi:hypothetical protein